MADGLVDALRDRIGFRSALVGVGVLVALRTVLNVSIAQLATTAATGAILALSKVVEDAYDLRSSVRWLGLGVAAIVYGGALLAFDDGDAWLSVVFLLAGTWLVADAIQTLRHDGLVEPETPRDGTEVYRTYVTRRVHETLDERPRTRRELSEALDADERDIDRALDALGERGVLERTGSELRIVSTDPTTFETARDGVRSGVDRLARPIALELETDEE
ncbi:MFS transporter [Halorussus marinus]|uniref:MFS transporter n=1 Tax=Halorussus marinus TaxID=2505976 RepID=UPI00106EC7D6|nr:MFS transporter [Halorussus marinus]